MDTIILYVIAAILIVVSAVKDRAKTKKALFKGLKSIEGILPQLIVMLIGIAVILALFDAETISRYLGSGSGFPGVLIAGLVGAITLIPGFVAFPAAGELLRNGAGVLQVATFVSSLMMVGVVTLPIALGSAAAGPLYGAFPVAAVLMRKGASFSNILMFIGAWSTTKIPMLLFEMNSLGFRFALARLAIDIPGIIIIALAIKAVVPKAEVARIYAAAATRDTPAHKKG
jgi:uncharacterized membrane protein YraQ (UPF0718 family)